MTARVAFSTGIHKSAPPLLSVVCVRYIFVRRGGAGSGLHSSQVDAEERVGQAPQRPELHERVGVP